VPTVLTAVRSTANINQDRRLPDLDRTIELIKGEDAPYLTLLRKLRKKPANDPKIEWMEDEFVPPTDAINNPGAPYGAGDTALVVDNSEYFRVGDVIQFTVSGECALITGINNGTDTLTVTRSWGGTAASASGVADNAEILNLGPAIEEGAAAPAVQSTVEVTKFNYVQDFRTPYGLTDELADETKLRNEPDWEYQRRKNMKHHLRQIERSLWFAEKNEDTSTASAPRRSLAGMKEFITTNVKDASGTLDESEFNDFIEVAYRTTQGDGGGAKWLFLSPIFMKVVNQFAGDKLRTVPGERTYGVNVMQYLTPWGPINLVLCRMFAESTEYTEWGFVVDMDKVWYREMKSTYVRPNIQLPSETLVKEEVRTMCSLEVRVEAAHEVIKGVTS
jgi:hypothetical protein